MFDLFWFDLIKTLDFSGLYQFIWNNVSDLFGTAARIYLIHLISFGNLGYLGYPTSIIAFVKIYISPLGGYLHPNPYGPLHILYSREVWRRYHHYTIVTAHSHLITATFDLSGLQQYIRNNVFDSFETIHLIWASWVS